MSTLTSPASTRPDSSQNTNQNPQQQDSQTLASSKQSHHHFDFARDGWRGFIMELFHRFGADQCGVWAAALSFFGLLSLVPLLVGGLALVGILIRDPHQAAEQVQGFVAKLLPLQHPTEIARKLIVSAGIEEQARRLREASGWAGIISLVSFLYTASRIYVNAAPAMNAAFRASETRNLWRINLYAMGLLFGTSILFLLSLLLTTGVTLLHQIPLFAGIPDPSPWWLNVILFAVGIVLNAVIFTIVYRFLPSPQAKVTWKMAIAGGIFVAVLFELVKQGFAMYLRYLGGGNSYDRAYGSLGAVAVLFLWIYFSSQLLLLGAEFARLYADIQNGPASISDRKITEGKPELRPGTTASNITERKPDRHTFQEGSIGWVSKTVSPADKNRETVLTLTVLAALFVASVFLSPSSRGRRSS